MGWKRNDGSPLPVQRRQRMLGLDFHGRRPGSAKRTQRLVFTAKLHSDGLSLSSTCSPE